MLPNELQNLLKTEIPIATHIAVHSFKLGDNELSLQLPLQPNVNHKGTLFGGSLYSACALACYGLFLSGLQMGAIHTNNIVIGEGQIRYMVPVDEDATVKASWNSDEEREQFFGTLHSKRRARVLMRAQVLVKDTVCAEFSGSFVAQLEPTPSPS